MEVLKIMLDDVERTQIFGLVQILEFCGENNLFKFFFSVKQDFKSELELQADSLKIEVKSLESEHENLVQDHEARHREIIHEVEEKWKQKLALQLEEQSTEIQNLHGELERQNEKWSESRRNLEEQLHSVQNELRNQEMAVSAKQKGENLETP